LLHPFSGSPETFASVSVPPRARRIFSYLIADKPFKPIAAIIDELEKIRERLVPTSTENGGIGE